MSGWPLSGGLGFVRVIVKLVLYFAAIRFQSNKLAGRHFSTSAPAAPVRHEQSAPRALFVGFEDRKPTVRLLSGLASDGISWLLSYNVVIIRPMEIQVRQDRQQEYGVLLQKLTLMDDLAVHEGSLL